MKSNPVSQVNEDKRMYTSSWIVEPTCYLLLGTGLFVYNNKIIRGKTLKRTAVLVKIVSYWLFKLKRTPSMH